jgi:hypothetical protein
MTKKIIKFIILPTMFLLLLAPAVFAVSAPIFEEDLPPPGTETEQTSGVSINANDVPRIIEKIALWLYRFVLALSTVFGLYAAFLYLSGNPKNVEKAHQQLKYAFIGVAIAIISFSIEAIVKGIISR